LFWENRNVVLKIFKENIGILLTTIKQFDIIKTVKGGADYGRKKSL
jgi:hypothetical protein